MNIYDLGFRIWDWKKGRVSPASRGDKNPKSKAGLRRRQAQPIIHPKSLLAFSLVEVLAAVALIGIITFLALPNIVRIKTDSEDSLAISRAEAINLSMASYVQAHGQTSAAASWTAASDADARYALLAPYLAYAPSTLAAYMPGGYTITLPTSLLPLSKVALSGPGGTINY